MEGPPHQAVLRQHQAAHDGGSQARVQPAPQIGRRGAVDNQLHTQEAIQRDYVEKEAGKIVRLSGWIHRKRDHGNLLFFDLRDHYGLTQCVTENSSNFFKEIEKVKPESVVCVLGKVVKRSADTINKDLFTGEIEIAISTFEVLSESKGAHRTRVCPYAALYSAPFRVLR